MSDITYDIDAPTKQGVYEARRALNKPGEYPLNLVIDEQHEWILFDFSGEAQDQVVAERQELVDNYGPFRFIEDLEGNRP